MGEIRKAETNMGVKNVKAPSKTAEEVVLSNTVLYLR